MRLGFLNGYDGPESTAICGDVSLCSYLCDQLEECDAIDMHKTAPRCFLNTLPKDANGDVTDDHLRPPFGSAVLRHHCFGCSGQTSDAPEGF